MEDRREVNRFTVHYGKAILDMTILPFIHTYILSYFVCNVSTETRTIFMTCSNEMYNSCSYQVPRVSNIDLFVLFMPSRHIHCMYHLQSKFTIQVITIGQDNTLEWKQPFGLCYFLSSLLWCLWLMVRSKCRQFNYSNRKTRCSGPKCGEFSTCGLTGFRNIKWHMMYSEVLDYILLLPWKSQPWN
jgi:hypothetical protein